MGKLRARDDMAYSAKGLYFPDCEPENYKRDATFPRSPLNWD